MSNKIVIDRGNLAEIPRTYIDRFGSITFKEEDVKEVAESLLMRSIFGLIGLEGFEPSVQWIYAQLNWADPSEISYALNRLKEFGMLVQIEGKYVSIDLDFEDYLSNEAILSTQYIFSTDLSQLIQKNTAIINSKSTGVYLWTEDIYKKFFHGIEILIKQANMEARNTEGKDMLVAFDFSMTEVTRTLVAESKDKGE